MINAGPLIRDAIRLRLMRKWLHRATSALVADGHPRWKSVKNYLYLVRRHRALAAAAGFRESDVYRM